MRHKVKGRKFGKTKDVREPFLLSITQNLFEFGSIRTTLARAKEVRSIAEKFITKAKNDSLNTRRALRRYFAPTIVKKIIERAKAFKNLKGGYTRILKTGYRQTDAAKMCIIEFVSTTQEQDNLNKNIVQNSNQKNS